MLNQILWTVFLSVLVILYVISVLFLAIYGFNTLGISLLFLHTKRHRLESRPGDPEEWPKVTLQLPIYNESLILDRLLKSVVGQDYPADRLQIQVLDDSTDETADFVPPPDWLKTVIRGFSHPTIGCVQARWGHLNSRYNLLTKIVTLAIDGHFIVEQGARFGSNLFLGFNGSAGIWRRACIDSAGGWAWDTLTEDLDLSYRAQLAGWKIVYLPEVVVPGEIPAQLDAFKRQQYRWAKGSVQTLRKLAGVVSSSRFSWRIRLAALLHLAMYIPYPFTVLTLLLTLPVALYATPLMKMFSWTVLASLGPPLFYAIARTNHLPRLWDRMSRLPLLMVLAVGISLNTALAVISGFLKKGGKFERTPKFNLTSSSGSWMDKKYTLASSPVVWGELFLAGYAVYTLLALRGLDIGRAISPGMILYAVSYVAIAGVSLYQNWKHHRAISALRQAGEEPTVSPINFS
jgi:cellulose synthase/poly-beta-1,6-N-acetylglucosamine synthase-like glycosyltransferase